MSTAVAEWIDPTTGAAVTRDARAHSVAVDPALTLDAVPDGTYLLGCTDGGVVTVAVGPYTREGVREALTFAGLFPGERIVEVVDGAIVG